eukprot:2600808-Rhodomonas_salina.1
MVYCDTTRLRVTGCLVVLFWLTTHPQVVNEDLDTAYAALKELLQANIAQTTRIPAATKAAPKALVIAGPSGVGKGTLIEKLKAEFPDAFGFSVSHTTRAPRPGEENGVHYHFVEKPAMEAEVKDGKFLEHADVHGNMYGTSFAACVRAGKPSSMASMCSLHRRAWGSWRSGCAGGGRRRRTRS